MRRTELKSEFIQDIPHLPPMAFSLRYSFADEAPASGAVELGVVGGEKRQAVLEVYTVDRPEQLFA